MSAPRQYGFFQPRNSNRVAGGKLAKQRGQWFEKELEMVNAEYRRLRLALVERVHPPVAGPPGSMRLVGAGPLDFMGVLADGRAVLFDAKTRENPASFSYDARDQHQIDTLVDAKACLAIAFLLIADSTRGIAYFVCGAALDTLQRGGRVQLRDRQGTPLVPVVAQQAPYRRGRPVRWDYLATVEALCRTTPTLAPEPTTPVDLSSAR